MNRNLGRKPAPEVDASPPSEALQFAQALLGKSIPNPAAAKAEARIERERLEWLATISPRHEQELRRLQSAEAEARRQREQLEWLATISTRHENELRRLQAAEAQARNVQAYYERLVRSSNLEEATWDPSKHPRRGGAPNAGWFASTGGAGGSDGKFAHMRNEHEATPRMLALAGEWWDANEKLKQYRREIETLPTRIANERAALGSGGRYTYVHAQNLAQAEKDLAAAKAQVPELEAQLQDLEQEYHEAGYDDIEHASWTPGESLVGGRGIEQVGRAVGLGRRPAGLTPTGVEFDIALGAATLGQLAKGALRRAPIGRPTANPFTGTQPGLPPGARNFSDFGKRIMKWGSRNDAARLRIETLTRQELKEAGLTPELAAKWRDFYRRVAKTTPNNPSAAGRADLMQRAYDLLSGD
jgi:hypothetical protein